MTRTGVLSLLIAAYAVTNTHQAYANPLESNPHFLQGGRNMQAILYTPHTTDLTLLKAANDQLFSQFINSAPRLEGHLTTDKIYYKANDVVFVDLLFVDSMAKTPYKWSAAADATAQNISVSILQNGSPVSSIPTLTKLFTSTTGPSHGFQFVLPATISSGQYLIVASHPSIATATRTFVVQDVPTGDAPQTAPSGPPPQYTATFTFFDASFPAADTLHGKIQLENNLFDLPVTPRAVFTIGANKQGTSIVDPIKVPSETSGAVYFSLALSGLNPGDIVTITASATLPDFTSADLTDTVDVQFNQEITIGNSIQLVTIQDPPQPVVLPQDFTYFNIHFYTESMSDLVPDVPQIVYFRSYIGSSLVTDPGTPYDISGANLLAYDPNLPAVPVQTIQQGVSSIRNGYGILNEFRYDDSLIYYIEWTAPNYTPKTYSSPDTMPVLSTVVLQDGTFRIPIIIEGIQSRMSNIEKFFDQQTTQTFPIYVLSDYTFTSTPVSLQSTYGSNGQSLNFVFGYANGYFFVRPVYTVTDALNIGFPPLLVFNNFPRPGDFANMLLNHTNGHIAGLANQSSQSNILTFPITGSSTGYFQFNAQDLSQQFYNLLITDLTSKYPTYVSNLNLGSLDTSQQISVLSALFRQVQNVPQADSQYFGKYGPIDEQESHPALQTLTTFTNTTDVPPLTVVMTIQDKILNNSQDLTIQFSTNADFNTDEIYLVQIKHKEQVLYQQTVTLKKRMQKYKVVIGSSNFNLPNGGILQVNLYRVQQDYEDFQASLNNTAFCNLQAIINTYPQLGVEDQNLIKTSAATDILPLSIATALQKLQITIPGSTCILVSPDLVQRFLSSVSSISIFQKPSNAFQVKIKTTCTTACLQGQQATVTLRLFNTITQSYVTPAQYALHQHLATLLITENVDEGTSAFYDATLPGKVYLENDVDFEQYKFIDPLSQVNQYFTTSVLTNSTDQLLDILLTLNNLRNSVFEAKLYSLLPKDQQGNGVTIPDIDAYIKAIPNTYEKLSQLLGYNVQSTAQNSNPIFAETDVRNYIDSIGIASNVVNLDGASNPYHREAPVYNVYQNVATGLLTNWALTLDPNYLSFMNKYQAETLFFQNNIAFTQSDATGVYQNISVTIGDLATNFKVVAQSYSDIGFGSGCANFTVGSAFEIDFDIPTRISVNDVINVTATIQNAGGLLMTVTPSLSQQSAMFVSANFSYTYYSKSGSKIIATPMQTYPFTSSATKSLQVPFTLQGLQGGSAIPLVFTFQAVLSNSTAFTVTITKEIDIIDSTLEQNFYTSGELQTNSYENDIDDRQDEVDIVVNLPTDQDLLASAEGLVTLYPTPQSYLIDQVRDIMNDVQLDRTLEDLINKLLILQQFIVTFQYDEEFGTADKYPDIQAMIQEAKAFLNANFLNIWKFRVIDGSNNIVGYDNYKFTNQVEGDVVLTSYVAMAVSTIKGQLDQNLIQNTFFMTPLADMVNDDINQNIAWLFSKFNPSTQKFMTTRTNYVNNYPSDDQNVLQSFIFLNLLYSNPSDSNIQNQLASLMVSMKVMFNNAATTLLTADALDGTNPRSYNPYSIASNIMALGAGDPTDYQTTIDGLSSILLRYVEYNGKVTIPINYGNTMIIEQGVMTVFGGLGIDRDAELSAYVISALASSTLSQAKAKMQLVANYLKTKNIGPYFGGLRSTFVTNKAFHEQFTTPELFINTTYSVMISANDNIIANVLVNGDYKPIQVRLDSNLLNLSPAQAGSNITFNIDAYNLTNPHHGDVYKLNSTGGIDKTQTKYGPYDSYFGYSFLFFVKSPNVTSNMTSQHGLSFSVEPLNQVGTLGTAAMVNTTFEYVLTLINQDPYRAQGSMTITIRPPACLSFDPTQFNDITGPTASSVIQAWESNDDAFEYYVYIRGLDMPGPGNNDHVIFNIVGTQVSSGECNARPFEVEFDNTSDIRIITTPIV